MEIENQLRLDFIKKDPTVYFSKLNIECTIFDELVELALTDSGYYVFKTDIVLKEVPLSLAEKCPFIKELLKWYPAIELSIYKFHANTYYAWHVDETRDCSINLVLKDSPKSAALFLEGKAGNNSLYSICELHYPARHYTLFNTKVAHCVFNLEEPRYLFTIGFHSTMPGVSSRDINYRAIRERCLSRGWL